jgi:hypothetical protein
MMQHSERRLQRGAMFALLQVPQLASRPVCSPRLPAPIRSRPEPFQPFAPL